MGTSQLALKQPLPSDVLHEAGQRARRRKKMLRQQLDWALTDLIRARSRGEQLDEVLDRLCGLAKELKVKAA